MRNINFCKALDLTMKEYGITNVWLSKHAQLSDQALSNFRTGKGGIKSENLERVIAALPQEACDFFFNQLHKTNQDLRSLILRATNDEKAEILRIVAASLSNSVLKDAA
jgi:hypothetical protein